VPAEVVWSPQSRTDLIDIYLQIAQNQPRAAERYIDRIESRTEMLVEHPRMGVRRPDIRPSTRMLVVAPYVILYETVPDTDAGAVERIEVVRVVDGRRDLLSLF
jgi:toxin ParE1/3/4